MPRFSAESKELIASAVRDKAFDCACTLIRDGGWKGFTMEKLAACMGVAKGTVYNYFKDKDEVIFFLLQTSVARISEKLRAIKQNCIDCREILSEMIHESLKSSLEYRFLHLAVNDYIHREGNAFGDAFKPFLSIVREVIVLGMQQGAIQKADPDLVTMIFQSQIIGVAMRAEIDNRLDIEKQSTRDQVAAMLLDGLIKQNGKAVA